MPVRRRHIERVARQLLEAHGITAAPVPVDALARKQGARIVREQLEGDVSGFLYRDPGVVVIGVNSNQAPVRRRFTVAHELGHLLLHEVESLHVDRGVITKLRSSLSSQGTNPEEIEANLFAAELLMPREFVGRDLEQVGAADGLDEAAIDALARRYKVSSQAFLYRLANLGYIQL